MKPEVNYSDIIVASCIDNRLRIVEWMLKHTQIMDPCFGKVSAEKYALETLLQEINNHSNTPSTEIIEQFAQKASQSFLDGQHSDNRQVFSVFWNTAMSILADVYYEVW